MRLLLIEDDPNDVLLLREALAATSWSGSLEVRENLTDGIAYLAAAGVDLVLLDLGLPDSRGLESVERLQERFAEVPVVVLTGLDDEELGTEAIRRGAQDYLDKNAVTGQLLLAALRHAVERAAISRELSNRAEELAHSNQDLQAFAYATSHDLQEPLRRITGFLKLLEERLGDELDETCQQYIGFVMDGSNRMQTMIRDLLRYSRAGRGLMELEPVSLEDVANETLRHLERAIDDSGAEVIVERLPDVLGHRPLLIQMLQNLVSNAIKFRSSATPQIRVTGEIDGTECILRVSDNGIGFDPEQTDEIFLPFRRLHNRKRCPGSGIGLATVKRIVERHDGKIWAESAPLKGSVFSVSLRLATSAEFAPTRHPP